MKNYCLIFGCILALIGVSVSAQTPENSGMQTYSPFTPEQLQEINTQLLSPEEGPMGPIAPGTQEMNSNKKASFDSQFFSQSKGEEEAEALETESADPYQPMSPVMTF